MIKNENKNPSTFIRKRVTGTVGRAKMMSGFNGCGLQVHIKRATANHP
jgi:hypothetical protein